MPRHHGSSDHLRGCYRRPTVDSDLNVSVEYRDAPDYGPRTTEAVRYATREHSRNAQGYTGYRTTSSGGAHPQRGLYYYPPHASYPPPSPLQMGYYPPPMGYPPSPMVCPSLHMAYSPNMGYHPPPPPPPPPPPQYAPHVRRRHSQSHHSRSRQRDQTPAGSARHRPPLRSQQSSSCHPRDPDLDARVMQWLNTPPGSSAGHSDSGRSDHEEEEEEEEGYESDQSGRSRRLLMGPPLAPPSQSESGNTRPSKKRKSRR